MAESPSARPKQERRRFQTRRQLFPVPEHSSVQYTSKESWSEEENKALVEFMLFHSDPSVWPSHSKKSKFWQEAALFIQKRTNTVFQRTGNLNKLQLII